MHLNQKKKHYKNELKLGEKMIFWRGGGMISKLNIYPCNVHSTI